MKFLRKFKIVLIMEEIVISQFEEIAKGLTDNLSCVSEDYDGNISLCTTEGFIYSLSNNSLSKIAETGGQPFSLLHDSSNTMFITDLAQQAIYSYTEEEEIQELIKNFEGQPFIGPNSLAFHENSNSLYFTDSGPLGETSLLNPRGSVYVADVEQGSIKALILNSLAHPSGIALSQDGRSVYVAETFKNRILKIVTSSTGSCYTSVFHQFSGRLGPTAMCLSDNYLYVAHFDFPEVSTKGKISVLNSNGAVMKYFYTPISDIVNLSFSKLKSNMIYITGPGRCVRAVIPGI